MIRIGVEEETSEIGEDLAQYKILFVPKAVQFSRNGFDPPSSGASVVSTRASESVPTVESVAHRRVSFHRAQHASSLQSLCSRTFRSCNCLSEEGPFPGEDGG